MSDPRERAITTIVLARLIAEHLRQGWDYRAARVYSFGNDFIPTLGTLGLGGPLVQALANQAASGGAGRAGSLNIASALGSALSDPLGFIAAIIVIFWFILRTYVNNKKLVEYVSLADAYDRQVTQALPRMDYAVGEADPMPELSKVREEVIIPATQRAIADGLYPRDRELERLNAEAAERAGEIVAKYKAAWSRPHEFGLQK